MSGHVRPDHVHLLLSVPPNLAASRVMQAIKGRDDGLCLLRIGSHDGQCRITNGIDQHVNYFVPPPPLRPFD